MPSVEIIFNAAPHHVLEAIDPEHGGEVRIYGGQTARVSGRLAAELATAPYADVEILDELEDGGADAPEPSAESETPETTDEPDIDVAEAKQLDREAPRRPPLLSELSKRDAPSERSPVARKQSEATEGEEPCGGEGPDTDD